MYNKLYGESNKLHFAVCMPLKRDLLSSGWVGTRSMRNFLSDVANTFLFLEAVQKTDFPHRPSQSCFLIHVD